MIKNTDKVTYRAVNKPRELGQIAELAPNAEIAPGEGHGDGLQTQYQAAVDKEQELRARLESVSAEERPTLQAELDAVLAEKNRLEELILSGAALGTPGENEIVTTGVEGSFPFTKKTYGPAIRIIFDE